MNGIDEPLFVLIIPKKEHHAPVAAKEKNKLLGSLTRSITWWNKISIDLSHCRIYEEIQDLSTVEDPLS